MCIALTSVGRHIAITSVNPKALSTFVACHLIPLDKWPGVKPIGVGEVSRKIIAKVVLKIIGSDKQEAFSPTSIVCRPRGWL